MAMVWENFRDQALLAAIVQGSSDAIFSTDLNDIVTSWNRGAERLFGYGTSEIIGKLLTSLIPPDRHYEIPRIREATHHGDGIEHLETVRVHKDRSQLHVSLTISPLRDATRRVVGASTIARDVTDKKLAEEASKQNEEKFRQQAIDLEAQLIASGRLVSVGEIAASMAHEFNNPLGIVMGFAQHLLTETLPDSSHAQALQIIDDEARRCQQLIQELLEFAKPVLTKFKPTEIRPFVEKPLNFVLPRLHKQNIVAEIHNPQHLPRIHADAQQLEQVMLNLYLNSIDAMPAGGKLWVDIKEAHDEIGRPAVIIAVVDTGFGIEENDLPKIFLPFFTAKKRKGLGLGLPICERIIKKHGGKMEVQSDPGKATIFKILFPLT